MDELLKKYRDRLRVIIILYSFSDRLDNSENGYHSIFRSEIKIQALDFLLRYPDFLCMELLTLLDENEDISPKKVETVVKNIYQSNEPELRGDEMEKFFHGAYESVDDTIAFFVSVGFLLHDSKRRVDGKNYDKNYYLTKLCADRIENSLKRIESVKWYFDRCSLIKIYFNRFNGSELKQRQYQYSEYSGVSYKSHIKNINDKVKAKFFQRFKHHL